MFAEYPISNVLSQLAADNLLPAIFFRTSRKQCDGDIARIAKWRSAQLPHQESEAIRAAVRSLIDQYAMDEEVITGHSQYQALVRTGVGAHHAGQLLIWRLLLEELMSRGFLRIMVATGTVAAGVDFPARTVVITAHSKRSGEGFHVLSSAEFQQMSGRAGRRGKDKVGICLVAPGLFSDARVIHEVAKKPPEPLRSAYFAAPSTVLNLLKYRNVDDMRFTVRKSLAAFLDRKTAARMRQESQAEAQPGPAPIEPVDEKVKKAEKRIRRKLKEAQLLEDRQAELLDKTLAGLSALGYVEDGKLTEKGLWAANLCTTLVLELGEAISQFLFEDLSVEEFVGLIGSIAGDPHRKYLSIKANPIKADSFEKISAVLLSVRTAFENPFSPDTVVAPDAAVTVIAWMESETWAEFSGLLRLGGVAEGDAARLIMQTADHLGQITKLFQTHSSLAAMAAEGRRKLLKPPLSDAMLVD